MLSSESWHHLTYAVFASFLRSVRSVRFDFLTVQLGRESGVLCFGFFKSLFTVKEMGPGVMKGLCYSVYVGSALPS